MLGILFGDSSSRNNQKGTPMPNPSNTARPSRRFPTWRILIVCIMATLLISSIAYRITRNSVHHRETLPSGLNLRIGALTVQPSATRESMQLLAIWDAGRTGVEFHPERRNYIGGNSDYPHGVKFALLGLAGAINPRLENKTDWIISPYAAIEFPYWFVIGVSALSLVWMLRPTLLGKCRSLARPFSIPAWIAMAVVLAGVFWLNWRGQIYPGNDGQNVWTLMVAPETYVDDEVYLEYGWPSTCLTKIWDHGKPAPAGYRGYDMGWKQSRLGENAAIAIALTLIAGLVIERLVRVASNRPKSQPADGKTL